MITGTRAPAAIDLPQRGSVVTGAPTPAVAQTSCAAMHVVFVIGGVVAIGWRWLSPAVILVLLPR
jgi:hypothetical protein